MDDMNFDKLISCCGELKKTVQKNINDSLKAYNLTSVHVPYLILLKENESLTLNELNSMLQVDKANTTRVINYLLDKKMIKKTDSVRKYKVSLTKHGLSIINEIQSKVISTHNNILSDIDSDKLKIFNEVLMTIINKLKGE